MASPAPARKLSANTVHLLDLLAPARIQAHTHVSSKKRLLEQLAALLGEGASSEVEASILDSLCSRERLGSTGLGQGVAIPHGRSARVGNAIGAFVRLSEAIDFGAPDGQPVDLVFALAVPEHFTHQHLLLLSQLAEMFGDGSFRQQLRLAADAASLQQLLAQWQSEHPAAA